PFPRPGRELEQIRAVAVVRDGTDRGKARARRRVLDADLRAAVREEIAAPVGKLHDEARNRGSVARKLGRSDLLLALDVIGSPDESRSPRQVQPFDLDDRIR